MSLASANVIQIKHHFKSYSQIVLCPTSAVVHYNLVVETLVAESGIYLWGAYINFFIFLFFCAYVYEM